VLRDNFVQDVHRYGDKSPLINPHWISIQVYKIDTFGEAIGQRVRGREWVAERKRGERCIRPSPHNIGGVETSAGAEAAAAEPVVGMRSQTLGVGLVHGVAYMSYQGVYPTPNILLTMARKATGWRGKRPDGGVAMVGRPLDFRHRDVVRAI